MIGLVFGHDGECLERAARVAQRAARAGALPAERDALAGVGHERHAPFDQREQLGGAGRFPHGRK
jgi:hypothetical protein